MENEKSVEEEKSVSKIQPEPSHMQMETSAMNMAHSVLQVKENLINKIMKSVPTTKLELNEENIQKSVLVNRLQGQIGDQYYVFTDDQKIRSRKVKKQTNSKETDTDVDIIDDDDDDDTDEDEKKIRKKRKGNRRTSKEDTSSSAINKTSSQLNNKIISLPIRHYYIAIIMLLITLISTLILLQLLDDKEYSWIYSYIKIFICLLSSSLTVIILYPILKNKFIKVNDKDFLKSINRLKDKHTEKNAYKNFNLWYDNSCDIPFKSYSFNLRVVEDKMVENSMRNELLLLERIFSIKRILSSKKQSILITGKSFFGKTSLIRRLAYDWATKTNPHYLSRFDLVIVIPLKQLGKRNIVEAIVETILESKDEKSIQAFSESKLNYLVLLDGYDEILERNLMLDFLQFSRNEPSPPMTIIITSKEKAAKNIRARFDWHFSLTGLSKKDKIMYIETAFSNDDTKREQLKDYISNIIFIQDLITCPQMLNILCSIYKYEDQQEMTVTVLYIRMIEILIHKYWSKYGYNFLLKRVAFLEGEKLLIRLGKLFFENLIKNKRYVLKKDLEKQFSEEEFEVISQLNIVPITTYGDDIAVSPFHQLLIEFFSAFYVFNLEYKVNRHSIRVYGLKIMKEYFLIDVRFHLLYGMKAFWDFDRLESDFTDSEYIIIGKSKILQFPADMEIFQICKNKITEERFKKFCLAKPDICFNIVWDSFIALKNVVNYNEIICLTIFIPIEREKWKKVESDALQLINSNFLIKYVCFKLSSCSCYLDEYKHIFIDLRSLVEAAIPAINDNSKIVIEIEDKFEHFKKISRNFHSEDIYKEEEIISLVYFALTKENSPPFSLTIGEVHVQFRNEVDLNKARKMILFLSVDQIELFDQKYSWWKECLINFNWEINVPERYTLQLDGNDIVSIL